MTIQLPDPYIIEPDGSVNADGVQRNFQVLAQAPIDTGGQQVRLRFGNDVVTWPGAVNVSNVTTVTHRLGGTPIQVYVSLRGGAHYCALQSNDTTWTSTTFGVDAYAVDGIPANGQQSRFSWLAIG